MNSPKDRGTIKFDETAENSIYIALHAHAGSVAQPGGTFQKSLYDLIDNYDGPEIYLDFCSNGRLCGIEILGDN